MSHVPFVCRCSRNNNIIDDNVVEDWSKQLAMKMAVGSTVRLKRKMTRDKEREQSRRALLKNLICNPSNMGHAHDPGATCAAKR
jgi:hypothetical protein